MSAAGFQWSDGAPAGKAGANPAVFAWSDEGKAAPSSLPNAGLAPAANARVTMQPSYIGMAAHPEGHIANPAQPAEAFALAHPEEQGKLATAAGIGAFPGGVPELVGATVGGFAGGKGGRFIAKKAGAGPIGQAVGEGVGGLIGGGIGASRLGGGIRGMIAPVSEALRPSAIVPEETGPLPEFDATGENKPYAGAPRPRAPRWDANDATRENKPFAGGMDEAPAGKIDAGKINAPQQKFGPIVHSAKLPTTELEHPVIGRASEMASRYPVEPGALGSPSRIVSPIEEAQPPVNTPEATDWHNQALQAAKEKLGPQAPIGQVLQEAAKIQQAGPGVIAPEYSPAAQGILGRVGKNLRGIRAQEAVEASEPDDLAKMLQDPDFIGRSIEAVKQKRLAAQKPTIQ